MGLPLETRHYDAVPTHNGARDLTLYIYRDGKIYLNDDLGNKWVEHWPQSRPWLSRWYPAITADLVVNPPKE